MHRHVLRLTIRRLRGWLMTRQRRRLPGPLRLKRDLIGEMTGKGLLLQEGVELGGAFVAAERKQIRDPHQPNDPLSRGEAPDSVMTTMRTGWIDQNCAPSVAAIAQGAGWPMSSLTAFSCCNSTVCTSAGE